MSKNQKEWLVIATLLAAGVIMMSMITRYPVVDDGELFKLGALATAALMSTLFLLRGPRRALMDRLGLVLKPGADIWWKRLLRWTIATPNVFLFLLVALSFINGALDSSPAVVHEQPIITARQGSRSGKGDAARPSRSAGG